MSHSKDVFVSYSSKDKKQATRICDYLEQQELTCWMAPRDVRRGYGYEEEIVHGIQESHLMILLISNNANNSRHVHREVSLADQKEKSMLPVRLEDIDPIAKYQYFLSTQQYFEVWGDAYENEIRLLAEAIRERVGKPPKVDASAGVAAVTEDTPSRKVPEKDGSELVLIPGGTFLYGSRAEDKEASSDEKPQQSIYLPDYYIGKYPVTNEQYCRFLNDIKPDKKQLEEWISIGKKGYGGEKNRLQRKGKEFGMESGRERHPVIMVSRHGAQAYAKWAGKELPSEVQWEKAARGTDGRVYPWGDEFNDEFCNYGTKHGGTTPVTTFKDGCSPYGCFDMAGNVWEWCSDWYNESNERNPEDPIAGPQSGSLRVVRGGSWINVARGCRCACRRSDLPGSRRSSVGFRVVFLP